MPAVIRTDKKHFAFPDKEWYDETKKKEGVCMTLENIFENQAEKPLDHIISDGVIPQSSEPSAVSETAFPLESLKQSITTTTKHIMICLSIHGGSLSRVSAAVRYTIFRGAE